MNVLPFLPGMLVQPSLSSHVVVGGLSGAGVLQGSHPAQPSHVQILSIPCLSNELAQNCLQLPVVVVMAACERNDVRPDVRTDAELATERRVADTRAADLTVSMTERKIVVG